jgi:hypothetical protein
MKKIFASSIFLIFIVTNAQSQADSASIWQQKPVVNLSGFVDVFYVYDFNRPTTNLSTAIFFVQPQSAQRI